MNGIIFLISLLIARVVSFREYGLLFENNRSYLQTGYLTLCDECAIKVEVLINRTSGVLMYAENRVRDVSLVVYFDRPGVYANVTDGVHKYNLPLTLDFFSSEWFGWHELEVQITETKMNIMFDSSSRQAGLKGKFLFPEDIVEENEIYFGASPRWSGVKNVTGFNGYMRNFMYKSCGCNEWRAMEIVNMVGVSTSHLGDCRLPSPCNVDCSCYLFPWGGKRCECPDLQCLQRSNDVSYNFDRFNLNDGRLKSLNDSNSVLLQPGVLGDAMTVNDKSSMVLYVSSGRSCFKNIFLCEKGFTHSFWILPDLKNDPESKTMIWKHSSSLDSTHGLTAYRIGNRVHVSLVTSEGMEFKLNCSLPLSIWSLITTIYNKTHFALYRNAYLVDTSAQISKINHTFPNLTSTRFLFIGNNRDNPDAQIDDFNFTYNVNHPRLPSIQELRLEQHNHLRKVNADCNITVDQLFVDLAHCYMAVFKDYTFTEFYISLIINLQMERSKMILIRSPFINITSVMYTALHIDLKDEPTQIVKLKLVTSRLYFIEISMNSRGKLVVRQNVNYLLLNVTLGNYIWSGQTLIKGILVNKERNVIADVRFINVDREFATKAKRIITGEVASYSIDFDSGNGEKYPGLTLTEGYIEQGLLLKYPTLYASTNWFKGACFKYVASCYHGFTLSFWIKIINNFQYLSEPLFKVFSTGIQGISLMIGKEGLYFVMMVETGSWTKFVPAPLSFQLYQWCMVELTLSPNGIASLFLNGREAKMVPSGNIAPTYKCSQVCIREETDKEMTVTMIIDEIKMWNVERDFLYAMGDLSSDTQSLLQQQKNRENKIKQLKDISSSLMIEKNDITDKLRRLESVLDKLKKEMKTIICRRQNKDKKLQNDTNQSEKEKMASDEKDPFNEIFLELKKLKCVDENGSTAGNGKYLNNDGDYQTKGTEEAKESLGTDENYDRIIDF